MENKSNPGKPTPAAILPRPTRYVYDFEICADYEEMKNILGYINRCEYDLIAVTQDSRDFFTIFFRRKVNG